MQACSLAPPSRLPMHLPNQHPQAPARPHPPGAPGLSAAAQEARLQQRVATSLPPGPPLAAGTTGSARLWFDVGAAQALLQHGYHQLVGVDVLRCKWRYSRGQYNRGCRPPIGGSV